MPEYRIYFLDKKDAISAREEFTAPNDAEALVTGSVVADAASDACAAYEIWSFDRLVIGPLGVAPAIPFADVSRERQEQILEFENAIQRSRLAIAKSHRLLQKTRELRALIDEQSVA